jgi:hypothetical protein
MHMEEAIVYGLSTMQMVRRKWSSTTVFGVTDKIT